MAFNNFGRLRTNLRGYPDLKLFQLLPLIPLILPMDICSRYGTNVVQCGQSRMARAAWDKCVKERQSMSDTSAALTIGADEILISRTDLKGNVTYVADSLARVLGYEVADLIGQPAYDRP